jgi:hypothetical protein
MQREPAVIVHEPTFQPVLGEATIEDLRLSLDGSVIRPGDADYDRARRLERSARQPPGPYRSLIERRRRGSGSSLRA